MIEYISRHLTVAQKAWHFASYVYVTKGRSFKTFKQKIRWAVVAAFASKNASDWFDSIQTPDLKEYVDLNPRLLLKPLRVYMSTRWDINRRIKVIQDTYVFIRTSAAQSLHNALLQSNGIELAHIILNSGKKLSIIIGHDSKYRKEGEMVVKFMCDQGDNIVSMCFSLECQNDNIINMYIGCIQGAYDYDSKELSKVMYGLRPKSFMVFIAQEIARSFGVKNLFGVGNLIQVHRKKHIIYIPSYHKLSFDYDKLWTEAGGILEEDGWFAIPLKMHRREHGTIKANKRSMYKRRYLMLDAVSNQIVQTTITD